MFLREAPTTSVGMTLKSKKLTPKLIRPCQIIGHVGHVVYKIALSMNLPTLYIVFHVSQLRKYMIGPSHIIMPYDICLKKNILFEVPIISIVDRSIKYLREKKIMLIKVI